MNIDKIFLALSESYRKAIASIILCTLMIYPILFFSINDFRNFNWYVQLLLSSGISTIYVGTYVALTIIAIKSSDVFFLPVGLVATCGFGEIIYWIYKATFNLQGFFCRLIVFTIFSIVLIYVFEYIGKRREHKESSE